MDPQSDPESDALASLEERIRKAVELVSQLRRQQETLVNDMKAAAQERDQAVREAAEARAETARMIAQIETLRAERGHVRARIEKLLGQMDLLTAS